MLAWSEKRRCSRVAKQLDGTAERAALLLPAGRHRSVPVLVFDVSRDGIGFVSLEPFERDTFARILIQTGEAGGATLGLRAFSAPVVVRHCTPVRKRGYKVGVMLRKEDAGRDRAAWNELIQYWSRRIL